MLLATSKVSVKDTNLSWRTVGEWVELVFAVGSILRPASEHYTRCDRLFRSLTPSHIAACRDDAALAQVERLFDLSRHCELPTGHGLGRCFTRSELGAMLVRVRNRREALAAGRIASRSPGPRFDLRRIPDDALARLIQQHRDINVVEACRAERARRAVREGRGRGRAGRPPA